MLNPMTSNPSGARPIALLHALGRLTLLACLLLAGTSTAGAQQPPAGPPPGDDPNAPLEQTGTTPSSDVVLELKEGQRPLMRLAFPELEREGNLVGDARAAADVIESTLRADLADTRVFEIQGPWAFTALTLTGDRNRDFEQYRSLGNEMLLTGVLKREGDRIVLEGTLYNLSDGKAILGKRYRGGFSRARDIAHTFADEILSYLTGRRGIARTMIAFTTDRDQAGRKEIYLMDYDGANQRRLTAHRSTSMSAAWKADASGVAYTSFFGGSPGIYFAAVDTGRKTPIFTEGGFNVSPTFSPDGRRVAFARSRDGNAEIFIANADGSGARQVTHSYAIDTNPAWSPNGNEIAFTSSRAGNPQIYAMDPEGTNVRRLTFEGPYNDNAAWSPDGTKIAYSTRRGGVFQIAVTDVVTMETRVLTAGREDHEDPTFSPDGRRIAFVRRIGNRKQVWVMDSDGSNMKALTGVGNSESPSWSPYLP